MQRSLLHSMISASNVEAFLWKFLLHQTSYSITFSIRLGLGFEFRSPSRQKCSQAVVKNARNLVTVGDDVVGEERGGAVRAHDRTLVRLAHLTIPGVLKISRSWSRSSFISSPLWTP